MAYMHIDNLYKSQEVLLFKELYALEKIHGTSASVMWRDGTLRFNAGGVKQEAFVVLFDQEALSAAFIAMGHATVTAYGEAYGGKCQGMSKTYGKDLRFVVFEVQIGNDWLAVPQAEEVAAKLGLPFVHYRKIPTDLAAIDAERDAPSEQARRNGIEEPRMREGVVLRPPIEVRKNNGERIVAKHKREAFSERKTPQDVDLKKRTLLEEAEAIALEWVTDMRLGHVLDKLGNPTDMTSTPAVIEAMLEDVCREAKGEILESKAARRAISGKTVRLYKARLAAALPKGIA